MAKIFDHLEPYVLDAEALPAGEMQLKGTFAQQLEMVLKPGESISMEPGAFVMCTRGLKPDVDIGGATQGLTRLCCAGESLFRLNYTNNTGENQQIALAPPGPGTIIPIDLSKYSGMVIRGEAFLAAMGKDWKLKIRPVKNVGTMCFGGQGIFLNEFYGSGMGFISGVGYISTLDLAVGEKMTIDTEVLLAFEKTVDFDVEYVGSMLACCCGGLGVTNTVVTGPGKVWLQSLPLEKLAKTLQRYQISQGGNSNSNTAQSGADIAGAFAGGAPITAEMI
uniref:Altered inheritance of mitochondria protein 24, mitochondrial n=1 Tax=Aplanochytrium stocchinoi TaxID=215587 RepID=A0A7S3PM38_9STRA|mmetsp:Transcript_5030/g.6559  ORF Transcript_5030/g.6559 Transcript_5030/m.6559 type:complete len:278 (+) Transcript_5030:387-1220(+)|eukprot:CAMPEP_0204872542 /NCGR_PEP_ID=MMETSP1348-20121228/38375_1 /ASSEMBLY_ACC=CAM_ASM_000700 /TAXON_ID=215587 /ORGANISM="Aplanochytrium stocchinoi, Strain GSBS06" /LENGTH=277 /DNA_ID=CAMNT_0052027437 /DNA_START=320 /DNA_END=1153 /DNA_ORIENTATION=+